MGARDGRAPRISRGGGGGYAAATATARVASDALECAIAWLLLRARDGLARGFAFLRAAREIRSRAGK